MAFLNHRKPAFAYSILLAFGMLLVTACGQSSAPPLPANALPEPKRPNAETIMPSASLEERALAAKKGRLFCPFSDECSPAVTMISFVTKLGVERCSGFLIAPQQILTNDHCLSDTALEEGKKSAAYAHFAAVKEMGLEEQTIEISRIVNRSHNTGVISKDYAVLELASSVTDRKPISLARESLKNREPVKVFRVQVETTADGSMNGKQTLLNCEASYKTLLYPQVNSGDSPLMTFGDCAVQKGNSGSPILNANGEAAAIVQAYLLVNTKSEKDYTAMIKNYLLDESYGTITVATQVVHMTGDALPVASVVYEPKEFLQLFGLWEDAILPKPDRGQKWIEFSATQGSSTLESGSILKEKMFVQAPECVSLRAGQNFSSSLISYRQGLNRFLQSEWRPELLPGEKRIEFSSTEDGVFKSELGSVTVPICNSVSDTF